MTDDDILRMILEKGLNIHDDGPVSKQAYLGIVELVKAQDRAELEILLLKALIMLTGMMRGTANMMNKDAHSLLDNFKIPDLG